MEHTTLNGKVALITGAASGIGAATASLFGQLGSRLVLTDCGPIYFDQQKQMMTTTSTTAVDINDDGNNGLLQNDVVLNNGTNEQYNNNDSGKASPIEDYNEQVYVQIGDICDSEFRQTLVQNAVEHFGSVDILVNCAGVFGGSSILEHTASTEELKRVFDVNVNAVVGMCDVCVPHLLATKGCIVNVESVSAFLPVRKQTFYCMSKAAVYSLTNCLAQELTPLGVRVNGVNPGPVETPLLEKNYRETRANANMSYKEFIELKKSTISPFGAICPPESVAETIAFLASEAAKFISGQHLGLNIPAGLK